MDAVQVCPVCGEKYTWPRKSCWVCMYNFSDADFERLGGYADLKPERSALSSFLLGILTVLGLLALVPVLFFVTCLGIVVISQIFK